LSKESGSLSGRSLAGRHFKYGDYSYVKREVDRAHLSKSQQSVVKILSFFQLTRHCAINTPSSGECLLSNYKCIASGLWCYKD
jgi:hypothetical protein